MADITQLSVAVCVSVHSPNMLYKFIYEILNFLYNWENFNF